VTLIRTGFISVPTGRETGFDHADIYRDGAGAARRTWLIPERNRVDVLDCAARTWLRALPDHRRVNAATAKWSGRSCPRARADSLPFSKLADSGRHQS
jgi:hypothetical protein